MEKYEEKFGYVAVIVYALTQYSLKCRMKELGAKWEMAVIEGLFQINKSDTFSSKSANNLTDKQKWDEIEFLIF